LGAITLISDQFEMFFAVNQKHCVNTSEKWQAHNRRCVFC